MNSRETSVAIIGSGPSGLALAIELGTRGIACMIVERNDRVGYAARAKTTNVRTRTHLRRWGIADRLAAASPFGIDYPSHVVFMTNLAGPTIARIEDHSNCSPVRDDRYPEHGQWIPQYKLEQVLRDYATSLPSVEIVFSTEFADAEQTDDAVALTLRNVADGTESALTARYLVGADGARSRVRDLIGATMSGRYGLSRNYNVVFRAPGLAEAHRHGPGAMYWQLNPRMPGLIGPMDDGDKWFFMPTRLPSDVKITAETATAMIRDATGIDLPYEILSSDEWVASSLIADRYRDRRIFLIGDAGHLHPPFGGYGMNMGVADGVDLGWKLAGVLQNWGGPALLDSYESERRPTHEHVIAEAEANHLVLSNDFWADGIDDEGLEGEAVRAEVGARIIAAKTREFRSIGTVLGGCYADSPVIASEDAPMPVEDGLIYNRSSRPGCLAPHLWRADASSLYDAFGQGFTLLCRPDVDDDEMDEALAGRGDVPLSAVRLTAGEAGDLYPSRLTLVRPDQFVVWRGDRWDDDVLDLVTGNGTIAAETRVPEEVR